MSHITHGRGGGMESSQPCSILPQGTAMKCSKQAEGREDRHPGAGGGELVLGSERASATGGHR